MDEDDIRKIIVKIGKGIRFLIFSPFYIVFGIPTIMIAFVLDPETFMRKK